MKEYMVIIRGGNEAVNNQSPEEMQNHMQKWQQWIQNLSEAGQFSSGQPLAQEGATIIDKGSKVIDRPLAEGKELIGGYVILKANDLKEASELAKGCPGIDFHCTLEVREINPM